MAVFVIHQNQHGAPITVNLQLLGLAHARYDTQCVTLVLHPQPQGRSARFAVAGAPSASPIPVKLGRPRAPKGGEHRIYPFISSSRVDPEP